MGLGFHDPFHFEFESFGFRTLFRIYPIKQRLQAVEHLGSTLGHRRAVTVEGPVVGKYVAAQAQPVPFEHFLYNIGLFA